jgi:hypothetical protein
MGAIGGLIAGSSFTLNRFTGPGRVGIQSMSYHPLVAEGAQQAGGQSNLKIVADLLSKYASRQVYCKRRESHLAGRFSLRFF